VIGSILIRLIA